MKARIIFTTLLFLLITQSFAQKKAGLILLLGPSVNMFYGSMQDDFEYTAARLNWQVNGQFGFISTRGGTNRGNTLAIFGAVGNTHPEMIALMQNAGAVLNGELDLSEKFNEFYTLEAGMIIGQFLRLSGGIGKQSYTYDDEKRARLNYFSGTVGFVFDLGIVNWVIDGHILAGKDMNQNALRFSTGFVVKF